MSTVFEIVQGLNPTIESGSQYNIVEGLAEIRVSESVFGTNYNHALALMILHIFTIIGRAGAGGQAVWLKEDALEIRFAAKVSDDELKQTSWGNMFLALARQCTGGSMSTRMRGVSGI